MFAIFGLPNINFGWIPGISIISHLKNVGAGKSLLLRQIEELNLGTRTQGASHQDLEKYSVTIFWFGRPREKSRDAHVTLKIGPNGAYLDFFRADVEISKFCLRRSTTNVDLCWETGP